MASRSAGGVVISDRSRSPPSAMFERARNGRRGEREHVHLGAQRLQLLLVAHAEAMFLVDDDQPEFLEAHVGVQQAVRGDDDVHRAFFDAFQHRVGFLAGAET